MDGTDNSPTSSSFGDHGARPSPSLSEQSGSLHLPVCLSEYGMSVIEFDSTTFKLMAWHMFVLPQLRPEVWVVVCRHLPWGYNRRWLWQLYRGTEPNELYYPRELLVSFTTSIRDLRGREYLVSPGRGAQYQTSVTQGNPILGRDWGCATDTRSLTVESDITGFQFKLPCGQPPARCDAMQASVVIS